jgi:serine/threonine-protein kinase SRPK3
LHDKYLFPKEDADAIASFPTPMLRLHPDKRAKASELIHHNWLDGIVVQGEVDVRRRKHGRGRLQSLGQAPPEETKTETKDWGSVRAKGNGTGGEFLC